MDIRHSYIKKGGNNNRNIISRIVNRVNLNPVNFGYLSTDDRLKGNDKTSEQLHENKKLVLVIFKGGN